MYLEVSNISTRITIFVYKTRLFKFKKKKNPWQIKKSKSQSLCNKNTNESKIKEWVVLMTRATFAGSRSQSILKASHRRMTSSAWVFGWRRNSKRSHPMTWLMSSIHFFTSPHGSKGSALTNTKLCRYNQYGHTQHKQKGLHCWCCWALLHWHLNLSLSKRPFKLLVGMYFR